MHKKSSLLSFSLLIFMTLKSISAPLKIDYKSFGEDIFQKNITDEKVIVTVNRFCELGKTFLSKNIILMPKNNKFSAHESYLVPLENRLTFKELEGIAQIDKCVMSVSKDILVEMHDKSEDVGPNDPKLSKQNHLSTIHFGETYEFFSKLKIRKNSIIAIIDNGLDVNHEDIKSNLWINAKEKNGFPGVDDDSNGYVDDIYGYDFMNDVGDPNHKYKDSAPVSSHGTHVAALSAGVTNNSIGISGVMTKNVSIMALNVFGSKGYSDFAVIGTAIRYAADMGANVINMSLGGKGASAVVEEAIRYAVSKKVFVVVSAGNSGDELTDEVFYSPASYGKDINGMIAVGAIDSDKSGKLCSFSNHGTQYVEISAPGCHTTLNNGGVFSALKKNEYGRMSGTSMASPIAAGVALVAYSYLKEHTVRLTPAKLEEFIKKASKSSSLLESDIQDGKTVDLQVLKDKIISNDQF